MKRILSLLLALLMCLSLLPLSALASDEAGESIEEEEILLEEDPAEPAAELAEAEEDPAALAEDPAEEPAEEPIEEPAEEEPAEEPTEEPADEEPVEEAPVEDLEPAEEPALDGMGTITNLKVSSDGIVTWNAYPGADHYDYYVNGPSNMSGTAGTGTQFDFKAKLDSLKWESGKYWIGITAKNASDVTIAIDAANVSYSYTSPYPAMDPLSARWSSGPLIVWNTYNFAKFGITDPKDCTIRIYLYKDSNLLHTFEINNFSTTSIDLTDYILEENSTYFFKAQVDPRYQLDLTSSAEVKSPAFKGSELMSITACGACGSGGVYWMLFSSGKMTVYNYDQNGSWVSMPDYTSVSDIPWYSYRSSIRSLEVQSGVKNIGKNAFYSCSALTSVSLPNSVSTIDSFAFQNCTALTDITIPRYVESIGYGAFSGCSSLTWIDVHSSNASYSSYDGVLFNKNRSQLILCPGGRSGSYTVPASVASIGDKAFDRCTKLTDITFLSSAPTFGTSVFYNVTATAYYPAEYSSWTDDVRQNYGGTITWVALIDDVRVTIAPPEAGARPSYNPVLPTGANYYSDAYNTAYFKNDVRWDETASWESLEVDSDVFEAGHAYSVTCYLTAKSGYAFSSSVTASVSGNAADVVFYDPNRKYIAIRYDFPELPAQDGWVQIGSDWYYYENGAMVTNAWRKDSTGWCYLGADGKMVKNAWAKDSVGWCWLGSNGYMVKSKWIEYSGAWYYLNAKGYMVTGWQKIGGEWYYFYSPSGKMAAKAWVKDSKGWLYMNASGKITKNAWAKDSVGWCYLGSDGYMVTNKWQKDSKGWCYLGSDGRMYISKWLKDGNYWYYLDENGYMVTGSKVIGGKTYKFDSNGRCLNP